MTAPRVPAVKEPAPVDREAVLSLSGSAARTIYEMVRRILDEVEEVAPWEALYYPPEDREQFLALEQALIEVTERIPEQVESMVDNLTSTDGGVGEEMLDSVQFFFVSIHNMAAPEMKKLGDRLQRIRDGILALTQEEREVICEISADLKGKYMSSIMGAAAGLIADDRWDGVELEPILFPEKAKEFERNRHLVKTLRDVIESTRRFIEDVPLAELVTQWQQDRRVDQYALTPLYTFLGVLGKLMKESSRRALYSGDYHQIRKRERLLSHKINELNMLHNRTWADSDPDDDGEAPYSLMVQRACEIAAILDIEVLRLILGDKAIQDLRFAVVSLSESKNLNDTAWRAQELTRVASRLPEAWRPLVPLLQDDDLKTFFDLLLGSVLKRASLALDAKREIKDRPVARAAPLPTAAPAIADPPTPVEVSPLDVSTMPEVVGLPELLGAHAEDEVAETQPESDSFLDFELSDLTSRFEVDPPKIEEADNAGEPVNFLDADLGTSDSPIVGVGFGGDWDDVEAPSQDRQVALSHLQTALRQVMSPTNPQRRQFDFLHSLLSKKKTVPPTMIQSIHPFLDELNETLEPPLREATSSGVIAQHQVDELNRACRALRSGRFSPQELSHDVPANMQQVVDFLESLKSTTTTELDRLSTSSSSLQGSSESFF